MARSKQALGWAVLSWLGVIGAVAGVVLISRGDLVWGVGLALICGTAVVLRIVALRRRARQDQAGRDVDVF